MLRPQMIVLLVLVAMLDTSNLCGQEPAAAQRAGADPGLFLNAEHEKARQTGNPAHE